MSDTISRLYSFSTESVFSSPELPECFWAPPTILFSGFWCSFPGIKLSGCVINHSPQSIGEVKHEWTYTSSLYVVMEWTREDFTFLISVLNLLPIPVAARSKAACLLGLRVRTPPRALMSVSCECCMLSGRDLCDGPIPRSEESYPLWCV